ncbi:MAG: hypothetical protein WEB13_01970 [Dehalococcoidia bacterium]
MVIELPERVKRDAAAVFTTPELPATFSFYTRLSPLHQRLFLVELWEALARASIAESHQSLRDLVDLVEAWDATADLDASPEVADEVRRQKVYRELA